MCFVLFSTFSDSCKLDFKVEDSQWAELPSVMHTRMFASPKNVSTVFTVGRLRKPLLFRGKSHSVLVLLN